MGTTTFVREGSMVDIVPGSALEQAYGGPSNLMTVPAAQLGNAAVVDKSALTN
jgi:hypothetical protein